MVSKKQLVVSILIILTFSLVILGGSYAYFSANVNGDPISNTVEAALLGSVDFVAGPNVVVPDGGIFPGWIGVQEFSINKPADMNAGVGAFEILMDTTVDVAYGDWVTYEIYKTMDGDTITRVEGDLIISPEGFASQEDSLTAVGFNIPSSALKKGVMNNTTGVISLHKENFDLATYQDTTYYVVYRFNNEEIDQSVAMGKEFSATIQVVPTVQFNVDVENMEMILAESTQYYEDLGVTPEPIDNFTYTEHLYHAEIVSYTGTSTDIVIPNEINGKPVTVIKSAAFNNKTAITNYTFPSSLEIVEANAFERTNAYVTSNGQYYYADREMTYLIRYSNYVSDDCASSMIIPEGTKFIGEQLCSTDKKVATLYLPDSLEFIGDSAFNYNLLKTLDLPNNLKYIGYSAFNNNTIQELEILSNVVNIGDYSFGYNEITSLKIEEGVEYIGNFAFIDNLLTTVTVPGSVKTVGNSAFRDNEITSAIFSDGVMEIGTSLFFRNPLTDIYLSNTLTKINNSAFYNLSNLKEITIPASVTHVGTNIFEDTVDLVVNVEGKDSYLDFVEYNTLSKGATRMTINYLGK